MNNPTGQPVILVAEDDLIHQQVLAHQLGLLGYSATIAANGAEALALWRKGGHGLLLTDLEMPVIDGYALARCIRREEAGAARLPILASTARALAGEADRALDAGIDECLAKPMHLDTLARALQRWLAIPRSGEPAVAPARALASASDAPVLDLAVLRDLVGGAAPLADKLLTVCEASLSGLLTDFDEAFASADIKRVAWLAHQLKSTSRAIGAARLGNLCAELAGWGSRASIPPLPTVAAAFRTALIDVQHAIAAARRPPCRPT